ncbi:MAG: cytochrome b/b6 domain-containing protein [Rhizobiaceae bacterium]|nr:cytochrome b/b6 domain-containing protein [Rhizobiaceae bacterium]
MNVPRLPRWIRPVPGQYTSLQKALHWLVVAILAVQLTTSSAIERSHTAHYQGVEPDPWDLLLHEVHTFGGLTVFCIVALRILLRIIGGASSGSTNQARLLRIVATVNHVLLYGVLLALPVTGVAARYLDFLYYGPIHVALTRLLLVLVLLHMAAALWHLLIRRDDIVGRMLPFSSRSGRPTG